jgi:hypothetical protein
MPATAGVSLIQRPALIFPFFLMIPENYMLGYLHLFNRRCIWRKL